MSRTPPKPGRKSVLINSTSSIVTIVLQITVLVWVNQYLLKRVSPEEYATLPVVMSMVVLVELFKTMFIDGLGRFIVIEDAKGDSEGVTRVASSAMPFLVAATVVLSLLGALAVWKLDFLLKVAPEYHAEARLMLSLVVVMLAVGLLSGPFGMGLYVKQRFVTRNLLDLGAEVIRIVILGALLFGVSTSVVWLVVASTASMLIRTATGVVYTRRLIPAIRFDRSHFSLSTARDLFGFGAWSSVGGVVNVISRTVPILVLNRFGTAMDLTCYHLGRLPDLQMRRVIRAALIPVKPVLTSLYAQEGDKSLGRLYLRGNCYILWLSLFIIAPLVVFAHPIIDAYVGEEFEVAAVVMVLVLGRYPFLFSNAMFYRVAHASGKIKAFYCSEVLIQLVTLAAMYFTVIKWGMGALGAALAIGVSSALMQMLVSWPLGLRLVKLGWGDFFLRTLVPGLLPCLASAAFCVGYMHLLHPESWLLLGGGAAGSLAVYALTIWMFGFDREDREFVGRGLAKLKRVLVRGRSPITSA